ncbi:hypothetical protein CEXT_27871, partial [Caerostris extrusa]
LRIAIKFWQLLIHVVIRITFKRQKSLSHDSRERLYLYAGHPSTLGVNAAICFLECSN